MREDGYGCIEKLIEVNMLGCVGEPLLATDYMSDAHPPVVDYVREVEGWPPIPLHYYEIVKRCKYD